MALTSADAERLGPWLTLAFTSGVGPVCSQRLLAGFGSTQAIFSASASQLLDISGDPRSAALLRADPQRDRRVAASLAWAGADDHHLVTSADPDYPVGLLQIADPPAVLHVVGQRSALACAMVAIVGSRNATAGGSATARAFARELSQRGFVVVSGLALGIDAAAHDGALQGGRGTVAVMGTGADVIYPSRHRALAEKIAANGAIVSELPLGTPPVPGLFPRRNRLIAGMSRGVLVVEAALQSGSLITARLAGDYGREVFAIPGSIHSPLARGCHALIRDGARLVESVEDLLSEWPGPIPSPVTYEPVSQSGQSGLAQGSGSADDDPILAIIGHEPVLPDMLSEHLGMPAGELGARLLMLELSGLLVRRPDGRVVRPTPFG